MAFGKAELIETLEAMESHSKSADRFDQGYITGIRQAIVLARQLAEPAAVVDEETAIRAMWSVEFGHSLLMYIEDVKRGIDSSDDIRRAAYKALRPYLRTPQPPIPAEQRQELMGIVSKVLNPFLYDLPGIDLHLKAAQAVLYELEKHSILTPRE